jgi:hypothetical protein
MTTLTPADNWWKSNYDNRWHAFPADQAGDETMPILMARPPCEHSVPKPFVERIPPPPGADGLCPRCLRTPIGDDLPPGSWHMAD